MGQFGVYARNDEHRKSAEPDKEKVDCFRVILSMLSVTVSAYFWIINCHIYNLNTTMQLKFLKNTTICVSVDHQP